MMRKISEVVLLKPEEEIDVFIIIDEYEKNGYRTVLNKELIEDCTEPYSYMLGFAKEEEI